MDGVRALVRASCNSSVSRVSLLFSMFQCFDFLVGRGHARGMRLGTRPMYAVCGVAFVAGVTGAGWRCPKTLYAHKQCTGAIRKNNLLLQISSNKCARLQGMKGKHNFSHINILVCDDQASYLQLEIYIQACNDVTTRSSSYYIVHRIVLLPSLEHR